MEWNDKEFDNVTSRIEKINMQFSKLLEEMNSSTETTVTPTNFKVFLGEVNDTQEIAEANITSSDTTSNYYANMIEKSRQIKTVPKHAIALDLSEYDRRVLDEQLSRLYSAKKEQTKTPIYNMKEIYENNKANTVVIDYSTIPTERALVVKKNWKDVLFSDIDLNKQIDVWGAVKRFCTKQVKIKF